MRILLTYFYFLYVPFQFQVKIWFQNRRTKWKKQENISNAEAAELMKAKNSQKERELVKPPAIQPPKILTENGLIIGKLSPSSSPFLRPSSSASSSCTSTIQMYQDSFKDSLMIKSEAESSPDPNADLKLNNAINTDEDEDSENRLVIAESVQPGTGNGNENNQKVKITNNNTEQNHQQPQFSLNSL